MLGISCSENIFSKHEIHFDSISLLKFFIGVVMMNLAFVLVFLIRNFIYISGTTMEDTNKFLSEKMLIVLRMSKNYKWQKSEKYV